jgi:phage baseplate assembly protein W
MASRDSQTPRDSTRGFLGVGWRFPLQVTPGGAIAQAKFEQRIEESVYLILSTARGERPMMPGFGCGIHELVFANNDAQTVAVVNHLVREALIRDEPRIDVLDVDAASPADQPNLLLIRVNYRVRVTNVIGNLVYPFYITEGR